MNNEMPKKTDDIPLGFSSALCLALISKIAQQWDGLCGKHQCQHQHVFTFSVCMPTVEAFSSKHFCTDSVT